MYGKVPPETDKSMLPSAEPKQFGLVAVNTGTENGAGEETVSLIVFVQLLASTTPTT